MLYKISPYLLYVYSKWISPPKNTVIGSKSIYTRGTYIKHWRETSAITNIKVFLIVYMELSRNRELEDAFLEQTGNYVFFDLRSVIWSSFCAGFYRQKQCNPRWGVGNGLESSSELLHNPLYQKTPLSNPPKKQLFEHLKNGLTVGVAVRCDDLKRKTATHFLFSCLKIGRDLNSSKYTYTTRIIYVDPHFTSKGFDFLYSLFGTKIIVVRQLYSQLFSDFLLLGVSAALFFVMQLRFWHPKRRLFLL